MIKYGGEELKKIGILHRCRRDDRVNKRECKEDDSECTEIKDGEVFNSQKVQETSIIYRKRV